MWLAIKSRRIELWSVAVVHLDVGAERPKTPSVRYGSQRG